MRSTGILPVPRHGQDARSTKHCITALALLLFASISAAAPPAALWPVYDLNNGAKGAPNRQLFQGFGDASPNSSFARDFHEGIDILAGGNGGEEVDVARPGTLAIKDPATAGGMITVKVNVGTALVPVYEYDSYLHVTISTATAVGANVVAGDKLGNISTAAFGAGSRHMHFDVATSQTPTSSNLLNPFMRFTADADRDPLGNKPALTDTNGDNKTILIVRSGNTNPAAPAFAVLSKAVNGDLDIIADAVDKMNNSLKTAAGPMQVGYSIRALFDQVATPNEFNWHNVRGPGAPYVLAKFDDSFFSTGAAATGKFSTIYADDGNGTSGAETGTLTGELRVKPNTTTFPESKHYIVTNASKTTGLPVDALNDQFWKTKAKDDGSADNANTANGVAMQTAAHNAEARFKDGDYEVNIFMSDALGFAHDVNQIAGKVRVDNFKQTATPALGGKPFVGNAILSPMNVSNTPFLPGHSLDPESAAPTAMFNLGQTIGVGGDEYYADLVMQALIFPHHASWADGDALANPVATTFVQSDDNGLVPLTQIWSASQLGDFDLLIDYDRDGKFSATLDGLGAFTVVPEPALLGCLVLIPILSRRRNIQ